MSRGRLVAYAVPVAGWLAAATAASGTAAMTTAATPTWGAPVAVIAPQSQSILGPELAYSPSGAFSVAFTVQDVDTPAASVAFATAPSRTQHAGVARQLPGARNALGLAFAGRTLVVLAGTSPTSERCCESLQALTVPTRGKPESRATVLESLGGAPTQAQLVTVAVGGAPGGAGARAPAGAGAPAPAGAQLAAIATDRGVWVAESTGNGRFGPARQLTAEQPAALATGAVPSGTGVVAWAASGDPLAHGAKRLQVAEGSARQLPGRVRTVLTVPAGHEIDELAAAPGTGTVTLAWIESWFDSAGAFHSRAVIGDLARHLVARELSGSAEAATALAIAANARGDQVVAFKTCVADGSCSVQVSVRRAGAKFGRTRTLGAIDPGQSPAVTMGPDGEALCGRIDGGQVRVSASNAGSFSAPVTIPRTSDASQLALALGPARTGIAAWIQGTAAPVVMVAPYREPRRHG